jgi:hypothetical protein
MIDLARGVVDGLKSQPLVLALVAINAIFMLVLVLVLREVAQSIERRDAIIERCLLKR